MKYPLSGQASFRLQLMFACFAALCLLAGVELLWYRNITRLVSALQRVDTKSRLIVTVHAALGSLKDAETAEREFTITGDGSRLLAFPDARVRVDDQLAIAQRLAREDVPELRRLSALTALIADAFASMRQAIATRTLGDTVSAADRAKSSAKMDQIGAVAAAIDASERAALDAERVQASSEVSVTVAATGLAFVLAFAIAGRAILRLEREVGRRRDAEQGAIEARDEAQRMSRAKSEFLAHVSHELRTPLNSVIGFSNVLLRKSGARTSAQRSAQTSAQEIVYLERIRDNGTHLLNLIDDLLDLAKIEAGKVGLELGAVSLAQLIGETVAQLEGRLVGKEVVLESQIPPVIAPLMTDERKLKQVLINLIGNAVKFTEAGSVTVRVETDPATCAAVRIEVKDTGIGIPGARQATIFEAFEQADRSAARRYGGTGLGLSIAQAFCHLMGYRLSVVSEVGKGSTFSVELPRDSSAPPGEQILATAGLAP